METKEGELAEPIHARLFVTGSTGELGRRVISELLLRVSPDRIVAGVRSADHEVAKQFVAHGIEIRLADYTKPDTLVAAFQGIDRLLLISSSADEGRVAQHENVINAAKAAKVSLIAYTSLLHADTSSIGFGKDHRQTEAILAASGIPYALLRHGWYMENHLLLIPSALKYGAVLGCAGKGRFSTAARGDLAEAAAVLLTNERQAERIYELAGDESYTLADFAAAISAAAGKTVDYKDMPEADYKRTLIDMKLPEDVAELVADADTGASKGELEDNSHQLSALIGHPTTAWRQAVERAVCAE
ncbi:SDR family oxidoreductase [Dyella sp. S184]|uniref:SDR family oxidoreductase n=1 Tax=Dyella sp. S184 TaxID=1641862 RepID=UPI0020B17106|nr:SDR family oxidoreductase [Dyella sp. S184]